MQLRTKFTGKNGFRKYVLVNAGITYRGKNPINTVKYYAGAVHIGETFTNDIKAFSL